MGVCFRVEPVLTHPAPPDPYVRNERIRFLGNQSLGTTLAHHCAARHGHSDIVDDPGCGPNIRLQQLLELLPADRTLTTAPTQPVSPCLFRLVVDDLQQAEVSPNTVVLEMPAQLQAEHVVLVFQGGMSIGTTPSPQGLLGATQALAGCAAFDDPGPLA